MRGGRGAQSSSTQKSAVSVIYLHSKEHKTFQGTLGTQDLTSIGFKTSLGPSITGCVNKFYFFFVFPLTILGHLFGHCPTLPKLRGPSWLLDLHAPQNGPKMDPARLISGALGKKKGPAGQPNIK